VYEGYKAVIKLRGANIGIRDGAKYVANVETAIGKLEYALNHELRYTLKGAVIKTDILKLKGDAAEIWHAYTHNIDAAVKDVSAHANVLHSRVAGSVDVKGNWYDSDYGLKFHENGKASAKAQSEIYRAKYEFYCKDQIENGTPPKTYEEYFKGEYEKYLKECAKSKRNPQSFDEVFPGVNDRNNPLYFEQHRLIPKDQLVEAKAWLKRKILEESNGGRSDQVNRYQETLDKLTDRINSNEGSESIPLTKEEAEELAKLAKEGGFDPAAWNLTTKELIQWEYIMKQAHGAGLSAALISVVLEVAPELLKIITKLFRDGDINTEDFKSIGFAALKGSSLGYVRGSFAAAITIACKSGELGVALKDADPILIGAVVVLTMNTLQNATLMAFGRITKHEFANRCIQDLLTTSCSLAFGSALQALLPELPVLGYMLGSFVGGVVGSFVYNTAYGCFMSFCVDKGCTFFGLVKQDYSLPKEIMEELGLAIFEYENFEYEDFVYETFEYETFEYEEFEYAPINIRFIRRGVINVGVVGYVTA
jgi:hypothetical protein